MAELRRRSPSSLQAFAVVVLLVETSMATFMEPGMRDYCQWELFNASCPDSSLVVMNAARYGRMRLGRCIDTEFQIGCSADVLKLVDGRCSGRPRCVIPLPDNNLHHQQPCNKDMMAYLEASYSCIAVSDVEQKSCVETGFIPLHQEEGYLSSYTAQELGHGVASCPWIITVKSGQKIRLTWMDFSIAARYKAENAQPIVVDSESQKKLLEYCHLYATVSEHDRSKRHNICAENTREYIAYTSTSNSVSIELTDQVLTDSSVSFIIKFSVTGCADFEAPKNAWTERSGDRVTVRCNHTSQSWHMVCKGVVWIGQTSECQDDSPVGEKVVDDSPFPTYGLVIAVIIGVFVGSFCGFLLLAIVLWCKRQTLPRFDPEVELVAPSSDSDHVCKVHRLPTGEYGYTHVWEVRNTQLPMPIGGGGGSSLHRAAGDARSTTTQDSAYQTSAGSQSVTGAAADHPVGVLGPGLTGGGGGGGGPIRGHHKEHVYECPIFDERFLLQRLQHYPHHCPHDAVAAAAVFPGRPAVHCLQHGRGFQSPSAAAAAAAAAAVAVAPNGAADLQTRTAGGMASPTERTPGTAAPGNEQQLLRDEAEEEEKPRSTNFASNKTHGYTAVFSSVVGEQDQQGNKATTKATENHYL